MYIDLLQYIYSLTYYGIYYVHEFKSCPIIHRASANASLVWMDYAAFQYQHRVPGETVWLVTLEDAVSSFL